MDPELEGAEPRQLWEIFDLMCRIPRGSHHEEAVMNLLAALATEHGFKYARDRVGNLCIKVPATEGFGNRPTVCLQGHADMVTVKQDGVQHDFDNDPIQFVRHPSNSNILKANGTSLGADNGIGVAAALTLAFDQDAVHPPLEILITVNEEDGMSGAKEFNPQELSMESSILINLDTEEKGEVYVESAGLMRGKVTRSLDRVAPKTEGRYVEIALSGMRGGHSGSEIHENRGNAILVLAEILQKNAELCELVKFEGGQTETSIPTEAKATVFLPASTTVEDFIAQVMQDAANFHFEKEPKEPHVSVREIPAQEVQPLLIREDVRKAIFSSLKSAPNGVEKWSDRFSDLVETSSNLGVVNMMENEVTVKFSTRSSDVQSAMETLTSRINDAFEMHGFVATEPSYSSSAWRADSDAPIIKAAMRAFEIAAPGERAKLKGVHGGLEIVPIINKLRAKLGLDVIPAVTFGPTIKDAHSPGEYVEMDSVPLFYNQLKILVKMFAQAEFVAIN